MKKIKGRHIIMVANQKGGVGKTTTVAEIAGAFKKLGVPQIMVNLEVAESDKCNLSMRKALGGHVVDLDLENGSRTMESFSEVDAAVEETGAVVVFDIPAALISKGNHIWRQFLESDYLEDYDSMTLMAAVTNLPETFDTALHVIEAVNHPNKRILYRGFNADDGITLLEDMNEWKSLKYPGFIAKKRLPVVEGYLKGNEPFQDSPRVLELEEWFAKNRHTIPNFQRKAMSVVIRSFDEMAQFLEVNLLPFICDDSGSKETK